MGYALTVAERLLKFTDRSGDCWLWTGGRIGHMQYGHCACNGRSQLAHRVSYEHHIGPIPDGMVVMHSCDVPHCVNPAHLQVGTIAQNQADMARKGRGTVEQSMGRQTARAAALAKPCPLCGGARVLSAGRVRCPRGVCRGGQ